MYWGKWFRVIVCGWYNYVNVDLEELLFIVIYNLFDYKKLMKRLDIFWLKKKIMDWLDIFWLKNK